VLTIFLLTNLILLIVGAKRKKKMGWAIDMLLHM